MTGDEMERAIEFILQQQAKNEVEIQLLNESLQQLREVTKSQSEMIVGLVETVKDLTGTMKLQGQVMGDLTDAIKLQGQVMGDLTGTVKLQGQMIGDLAGTVKLQGQMIGDLAGTVKLQGQMIGDLTGTMKLQGQMIGDLTDAMKLQGEAVETLARTVDSGFAETRWAVNKLIEISESNRADITEVANLAVRTNKLATSSEQRLTLLEKRVSKLELKNE
ncbi:MAG: hypothetical protein RMM17_03815 [Acidobacteriota bacterium]|nr:hypothetical protein [Acidobacteriota bacterium]